MFTWEGCAALAIFLCSFGERGKGWTTLWASESSAAKLSLSCSTPWLPAGGAVRPLCADSSTVDCPSPIDDASFSAISEDWTKQPTYIKPLPPFVLSKVFSVWYLLQLCLQSKPVLQVYWKICEDMSALSPYQAFCQNPASDTCSHFLCRFTKNQNHWKAKSFSQLSGCLAFNLGTSCLSSCKIPSFVFSPTVPCLLGILNISTCCESNIIKMHIQMQS